MKKYMVVAALLALALPALGQEPNAPAKGVTAWALLGTTPEFARSEELRIGYVGLLPDLELAAAGVHMEAPDATVEAWSGRAYALFHALDAEMMASILGDSIALPKGNIYGGLFGAYTFDREDEWSGGWVAGALVAWPKGWQTVGEYQSTIWNSDDNAYMFVLGLRKLF